jgi:radical SAM superfamily enzyme YgiQ (UPF0313 family)
MLNYDMPLWRPPSEGNNLIIQATIGCSFNRCSFCSMYRTKTFQARPLDKVFADIDAAARVWPNAHRVFLADGDALVLPKDDLMAILDRLLPANLIKKSVEELAELKRNKLTLIYFGMESGSGDLLKRISKGASPRAIVQGLGKAQDAGLKVSATVILGLGGRTYWREHIDGTAALVNETAPTYLSTLQLGLDPMIEAEFHQRFVRSNHASNALPLAGMLPKDRDALLAVLESAQAGAVPLRPSDVRGH